MSSTVRCFLALGICVMSAAACGDDVARLGSGGSSGTGGQGASAGIGGARAQGGNSGTGGTAGSGGAAGTGGTAGTGGSAGSGGSAGTGGSPGALDGGVDATTPPNGDCPNFAEAAQGVTAQNTQAIIISRVVFAAGGATVTFRGTGGAFNFGPPMLLCAGPDNCIDGVQDLDQSEGDDALLVGEEVSIDIPNVSPAGGELALINDDPTIDSLLFVYIAWGTFVSLPINSTDGGPPLSSLEERAFIKGFWTEDERIDVGDPVTINTIYVLGAGSDTAFGDAFAVCTGS